MKGLYHLEHTLAVSGIAGRDRTGTLTREPCQAETTLFVENPRVYHIQIRQRKLGNMNESPINYVDNSPLDPGFALLLSAETPF